MRYVEYDLCAWRAAYPTWGRSCSCCCRQDICYCLPVKFSMLFFIAIARCDGNIQPTLKNMYLDGRQLCLEDCVWLVGSHISENLCWACRYVGALGRTRGILYLYFWIIRSVCCADCHTLNWLRAGCFSACSEGKHPTHVKFDCVPVYGVGIGMCATYNKCVWWQIVILNVCVATTTMFGWQWTNNQCSVRDVCGQHVRKLQCVSRCCHIHFMQFCVRGLSFSLIYITDECVCIRPPLGLSSCLLGITGWHCVGAMANNTAIMVGCHLPMVLGISKVWSVMPPVCAAARVVVLSQIVPPFFRPRIMIHLVCLGNHKHVGCGGSDIGCETLALLVRSVVESMGGSWCAKDMAPERANNWQGEDSNAQVSCCLACMGIDCQDNTRYQISVGQNHVLCPFRGQMLIHPLLQMCGGATLTNYPAL